MRSTNVATGEQSPSPIWPRPLGRRRRLLTGIGTMLSVGGLTIALTFLAASPVAGQGFPGGGAPPNGGQGPGGAPPDGFPGGSATPGAFPTPGGDGRGRFGGMTALTLVTVGSVNGGTGGDFGANSPGSDSLSSGAVMTGSDSDATVNVFLRGAQASATYDVEFVRFNDHGREDLGQISTDSNGNYQGNTPRAISGAHRVGAFVLIRDGHDQYVTEFS